jgi:hypothetical protein
MQPHSWIVTCKATGKAIFETFSKKVADAVNRRNYNVETAHDYLCRFNAELQAASAKSAPPAHA